MDVETNDMIEGGLLESGVVSIPVLHRQAPPPGSREYYEFWTYESGNADEHARQQFGSEPDRWLSVLRHHGPHSLAALDFLLEHPFTSRFVRGQVLDCGAGSCWLAGRVSRLAQVDEVIAFDLSEKFLSTVGLELFLHCGGNANKLKFATGTFNQLPFESGVFDCAFLFGVVHHSLAPISLIHESLRTLKPDGAVFILESPVATLKLETARRHCLEMSSGVTEIALTYRDLLYYFRMAGAGKVISFPLDRVTRARWRLWARRLLRASGLEDFLRPPTYVFVLRKDQGP